MKLVEDDATSIQGMALMSKDHTSEMHIEEAGDHLVRHGAEIAGRAGLVAGLFAPHCSPPRPSVRGSSPCWPSSPSTAARAESRKSSTRRCRPAPATLIAIYEYKDAEAVRSAVANCPKTSLADIDGKSAPELKAGLAEAQAGMGG